MKCKCMFDWFDNKDFECARDQPVGLELFSDKRVTCGIFSDKTVVNNKEMNKRIIDN